MSRASTIRISGKSLSLPAVAGDGAWKFTQRPGGWWIAEHVDGRRVRFAMSETRTHLSASLAGWLWHGEVPREEGGRSTSSSSNGGDSDLTAQFPGKVRKILVTAGALVAEGDPLVLVEAMKMEFTIKAPMNGTITSILVKEGQQLAPGDRFLELEALRGAP